MIAVLRPYFLLSRPLNCLIAFLSICAATVLAGAERHDVTNMLIAGLVGALVAAGANAINDYCDVEIDRINRPDRPLPAGLLSRQAAWRFWMVTSLLGAGVSALIGHLSFLIAAGAIVLLYFYSRTLKATPLVGNVVVGGMTGLAFIFGGIAVGAPERALMPAVFAFLVNVAREIVKDIEDRDGDARELALTLPIRYGVWPARFVTTLCLVILMATTILAYEKALYAGPYLAIVLVADAMLAYVAVAVWAEESPAHMRRLSTVLKATMVVGLAAIFFGSRG